MPTPSPLPWRSFLLMAGRHAGRNKGYVVLSVLGLAVGLATCLLIGVYVQASYAFDRHHPQRQHLYRMVTGTYGEPAPHSARTPPALALALPAHLPGLASATRLFARQDVPIRTDDEVLLEPQVFFCDTAFAQVFGLTTQHGLPTTALAAPHTAVLTASAAERFFGTQDVVGRTLDINHFSGFETFTITGVLPDPPATHLPYTVLLSQRTLPRGFDDPTWWHARNVYTYARLHQPLASAEWQPLLDQLVRTTVAPVRMAAEGHPTFADYAASGRAPRFFAQPIGDVYLATPLDGEPGPTGHGKLVYLLALVALFILVLAVINFVNLVTAHTTRRAREVGIRKVLGSSRLALIAQFLMEAVLAALLAFVLALGLAQGGLSLMQTLTGLPLTLAPLLQGPPLLGVLLGVVLVGMMAGSYPAFYLSRFAPVAVLKGATGPIRGGAPRLRQALLAFQFALTFVLLMGTGMVYQQMQYWLEKDLGFDAEAVVVVERAWELEVEPGASLRQALLARPDVLGAAFAGKVPGRWQYGPVRAETRTTDETIHRMTANLGFLDVLGIERRAGRSFTEDFQQDSLGVLLNEAAVRLFGWDQPLGQTLALSTSPPETVHVVGVVADFHFSSLHRAVGPPIIRPEYGGIQGNYLFVRVRIEDLAQTVQALQSLWHQHAPDAPFHYGFLETHVARQYAAEQRTSQFLMLATALAIFLGLLGLIGLSAYTARQRTREVGIRKVLGATVPQILRLLMGHYLRVLLLAAAFALPLGYALGRRWQAGFAYQPDPAITLLVLLPAGMIVLALLAIGAQTWRAAVADPVATLRTD